MTSSLVNPLSFQLGDTGVILNDDLILPNQPFIDISKVSGLDNAPYRETKRDHEGTDGGFLDAEFETGRDITLEGTVFNGTALLEPYLDSLKANFAPVTTPIPFYFTTESGLQRQVFVKPRGAKYTWDANRRVNQIPIQFLLYAEDPRIYDTFINDYTIPLGPASTTGFSFNLSFSFGFGASSTGPDGQYIFNNGNRPTPAVMTITGPVVNPEIINDNTGDILQFNLTLGSTDILVVDLQYHTVRLNGTTNRRNTLLAPNWFLFPPGATFIRFRGDSGTGTLNIQCRNAWR